MCYFGCHDAGLGIKPSSASGSKTGSTNYHAYRAGHDQPLKQRRRAMDFLEKPADINTLMDKIIKARHQSSSHREKC
jgi:hypothetical protein